jgi:hypothetical protein
MPILGVIASSTRQGQATDTGAMFPIFATTINTSTASITFSNIPSTYAHLQVRIMGRSTGGSTTIGIRVNGDTNANYVRHFLYGDGTSAGAGSATSQTSMGIAYTSNTGDLANTYAANVVDILDYAKTNKFKTFRSLTGNETNSSGFIQLSSGLWRSTVAINSLTFFLGADYQSNTNFALYGIK